jgi:hypothetical protein
MEFFLGAWSVKSYLLWIKVNVDVLPRESDLETWPERSSIQRGGHWSGKSSYLGAWSGRNSYPVRSCYLRGGVRNELLPGGRGQEGVAT